MNGLIHQAFAFSVDEDTDHFRAGLELGPVHQVGFQDDRMHGIVGKREGFAEASVLEDFRLAIDEQAGLGRGRQDQDHERGADRGDESPSSIHPPNRRHGPGSSGGEDPRMCSGELDPGL